MEQTMNLPSACVIAFLLIVAGHFLPWPSITSNGEEVKPPVTYIIGVLMLLVPFSFWVWLNGVSDWQLTILGIWAITASGGAANIASYVLDAWIARRHQPDAIAPHRLRELIDNWFISQIVAEKGEDDGQGITAPSRGQ